MGKEKQKLSIGSKFGCFTIIGDDNLYPKEPINDYLVKRNLERQMSIKQKVINGELPQDYKLSEHYVCKCQCGKEYYLSKEVLLAKKRRYCSEDCFTDIVYDKTENFDMNYTNTIHESLKILECTDENYENWSWVEKTRSKRIKHIKLCKKYKCQCYLCKKEYVFKSLDFEIKNDDYGRNADIGYYSDAYCNCHKISSFQWRTVKILKEYNINYKVEVSFSDLVGSKNLLRYDFAIFNTDGSIEFLIECQGKQHYEPVKEFGGKSQFEYQSENDKLKREYAKKSNITLVEIPYTCNTYEKELEFLQNHKVI